MALRVEQDIPSFNVAVDLSPLVQVLEPWRKTDAVEIIIIITIIIIAITRIQL